MDDIDVTFCVVTYNHSKYIERAIESVVQQEFVGSRELIIGVDRSDDDTLITVRRTLEKYRFDGKVQVIAHTLNVGACANYRAVHQAASGKYVAHLDGDDYFASADKTHLQINILDSFSSVDIVFTGRVTSDVDKSYSGSTQIYGCLANLLKSQSGGDLHSSKMYRKRSPGEFPSSDFLDKEMHLLHSQNGKIAYLDLPLTYYREHTGVSRNKSLVRHLFLKAIKNRICQITKREQIFFEYLIYAELMSKLLQDGKNMRIKRLFRTRLRYNYLLRLKLLKMKLWG